MEVENDNAEDIFRPPTLTRATRTIRFGELVRPSFHRMELFRLLLRNSLRHKLRSVLTIFGVGVAVMAFALLQTVVYGLVCGSRGLGRQSLDYASCGVVRFSIAARLSRPYRSGAGREQSNLC